MLSRTKRITYASRTWKLFSRNTCWLGSSRSALTNEVRTYTRTWLARSMKELVKSPKHLTKQALVGNYLTSEELINTPAPFLASLTPRLSTWFKSKAVLNNHILGRLRGYASFGQQQFSGHIASLLQTQTACGRSGRNIGRYNRWVQRQNPRQDPIGVHILLRPTG